MKWVGNTIYLLALSTCRFITSVVTTYLAFRPNSFIEDSNWDKYMMEGNGESYGINLYMYNRWRRFSWQLSYSFSKSREWYAELPKLGKIPSLFDLPHDFNAFISYDIFPHSTFTIGGIVNSGKFPYDSFYGDENNKLETFRTQPRPNALSYRC